MEAERSAARLAGQHGMALKVRARNFAPRTSPCRPVASQVSSQLHKACPFTPHSPPSHSQLTTSRGGGGLSFEDRSPSQGPSLDGLCSSIL